MDKSYLERKYTPASHVKIIDSIANKFNLNQEQERAFCIITNHACSPASEQLKMYLGGMGGTGKTQVLKAVVEFFKSTNQPQCFLIAAPTGAAAAVIRWINISLSFWV